MKQIYECMLLLDNREVREGWQALKGHVEGQFAKHGCVVKSARRWEERRLAYPIKHQFRATYLLIYMEAETEAVSALRRDLQFDEKVLRDMILHVDVIPEGAFDPEEEFDETAVLVEDVTGPTAEEVAAEREAEEAAAEAKLAEANAEAAAETTAEGGAEGEGESKEETETVVTAPAEGTPEVEDK